MKTRRLALRLTLNSAVMIFGVYLVLQFISYFRDNIILGISDLSALVPTVASFLGESVLPPMVVFAALLYLAALPLERTQRRLEQGEVLGEEQVEDVRRRIRGYAGLVLTVNLIGFAVGYVLSQVFSGKAALLLSLSGLIILTSNLAGALSYSRAQNALNNLTFADLRELLGMREIGSRRRSRRSTLKQIGLTGALVFYSLTFMQFNISDVLVAQGNEMAVLDRVRRGELSAAAAGEEYRASLGGSVASYSSRTTLDVESVPLPWERQDSYEDRQRLIFFMYALFIFLIVSGIQAACSLDLRDQISALQGRLREVLGGNGDLRRRINLRDTDDIGELTELVNRLLDRFEAVVERIVRAAAQTGESAEAIAAVLEKAESTVLAAEESFVDFQQDLERQASEAEGLQEVLDAFAKAGRLVEEATERQRGYVTDSSSAMEEMASSIAAVESMTRSAGELTGRLSERGNAGGAAVQETAAAIEEIRLSSERVLEVLGALNKIASSTKLLAMNASIEAAHAGDQGMGFAVVAEEVRNLAADAASENKRIRELIAAMRDRVSRGVGASETSGSALAELSRGLDEAAKVSLEIAAAMKEQTEGTRSAADALQRIVTATEDIGERSRDQERRTADMGEALKDTIRRLADLVAESRRQAYSVAALRGSFAAVRSQVDRTTAAAKDLDQEISRFRA